DGQVLPRPRRRRDPVHPPLLGHDVPRRTRIAVDRAGALEQGDGLPPAGGGVAGGDGPAFPQQRLAAAAARHARQPAALQVPADAADVGRHDRGAPAPGGDVMSLDAARRIADTVLYEGYILYPYRAPTGRTPPVSAGSSASWRRSATPTPIRCRPGPCSRPARCRGRWRRGASRRSAWWRGPTAPPSTCGSGSSTSRPGSSKQRPPKGSSP